MKSFKIWVNNQRGVATTEFIIVSFIFVLIFAAFVMISDIVLIKMKSLILARNVAFNQIDGIDMPDASFNRDVVYTGQAPSVMMDKCFTTYLASRRSRVKAHVDVKIAAFFKEFIPAPKITEHFQITEDTWKDLSPLMMGSLVTDCPG